jgi:hypothetical protein
MSELSEIKPNGGGRIDTRVAQYIAVRDEIARLEEEHKAALRPLNALKEKLKQAILNFFDKTGQTSAKTKYGTASAKVVYTSPLSDPDLFMNFVRENDAYELMDRRANSTAVREYLDEHDGQLPPGVKLNARRTVGVTKS